jgi:hypothetical protein
MPVHRTMQMVSPSSLASNKPVKTQIIANPRYHQEVSLASETSMKFGAAHAAPPFDSVLSRKSVRKGVPASRELSRQRQCTCMAWLCRRPCVVSAGIARIRTEVDAALYWLSLSIWTDSLVVSIPRSPYKPPLLMKRLMDE